MFQRRWNVNDEITFNWRRKLKSLIRHWPHICKNCNMKSSRVVRTNEANGVIEKCDLYMGVNYWTLLDEWDHSFRYLPSPNNHKQTLSTKYANTKSAINIWTKTLRNWNNKERINLTMRMLFHKGNVTYVAWKIDNFKLNR